MKNFIFFFIIVACSTSYGQNPSEIIKKSCQQFQQLKSYTGDVQFLFDIPSINIKNLKAKVFYKSPDKYRIKTEGIAFVPNENPMKIYKLLSDQSKYQALSNGTEKIQNQPCHIINIIPNQEADFILGKLWINTKNYCPLKIEFTTSRGTISIENYFQSMIKYGLPDRSIFYLNNFKPVKEKGLGPKKDVPEKTKKATITLSYSNYQINVPVADSFFVIPKSKKKE